MSLVLFLLTLGLVARATRLIVRDSITQPIRDWFYRQSVESLEWDIATASWKHVPWQNKVAKFVHQLTDCDWCTSVWVSAGAFTAAYHWGDNKAFFWIAAAASASYLVGAAQGLQDSWDHEH